MFGLGKKNNENKDNKDDIKDKDDNRPFKNIKLDKEVLIEYSANNKLIEHQILSINDVITNIITKYNNYLAEVKDKRSLYKMDYSDYRYLYEEFINLVLIRYQFQSYDARKYFLYNDDVRNTNVDNVIGQNKNIVNIDFKQDCNYSSENICNVIPKDVLMDLHHKIDNEINKICVCNNNLVNLQINTFIKIQKKEKDVKINSYNMICNYEYFTTISRILTISNICKNKWLKLIHKEYLKSKEYA